MIVQNRRYYYRWKGLRTSLKLPHVRRKTSQQMEMVLSHSKTVSSPSPPSVQFSASHMEMQSAVLRDSHSLLTKRLVKSHFTNSLADLTIFLRLLQHFTGLLLLLNATTLSTFHVDSLDFHQFTSNYPITVDHLNLLNLVLPSVM